MRTSPVLVVAAALLLGAPASPVVSATTGCGRADPVLPHWARARAMTVLHDSVLLSGETALKRGFPCWRVRMLGRPALMLRDAEREIRTSGRRVAPLVVVGIGYNSLWERNGVNHGRWAERFDGDAFRLLRTLRRAGAEQFVWVTLRRANRATTAPSAWSDLRLYSWYFPYVNDRLRRLNAQRNRLVLAEWAREGARPDVTYDSIHLNARGGRLMQRLIETTIYEEAHAQVERGRAP
ncbi:MAG: hypothetical protein WKF96_09785 [Solirubrobacteraceae bacterium]